MRTLIRTGVRCLRLQPLLPPPPLGASVRFWFAKVSKKEETRSEKKKEKSQAKEALGGNTN
jgi:hypothetical protein